MSDAGQGPGAIERPALANETGDHWGSDVMALMLREIGLPYVALNPGASLSRTARQPRQPLGQPGAADAAVPARGACGRHRARLRQGRRQADGRDRPQQCRADARDDGGVQRLVRPGAGGPLGRDRAGRRRQAAALDRLDPHRRRPGRAHPQLHQMGRPAGLGRGGAGIAAARLQDRDDPALRPGIRLFRRRAAGDPHRRPTGAADRPARPPPAFRRARSRGRKRGRRAAASGAEPGDPDGPGVAQRGRLGTAVEAGRGAGRDRADRPQDRRQLPHPAPAARPARRQQPQRRSLRGLARRPMSSSASIGSISAAR